MTIASNLFLKKIISAPDANTMIAAIRNEREKLVLIALYRGPYASPAKKMMNGHAPSRVPRYFLGAYSLMNELPRGENSISPTDIKIAVMMMIHTPTGFPVLL